MVEALWDDLRYSIRGLRRAPGFTAVVVLTLALGIGATTAIFSLLDRLILRTLPVRDPERLVMVAMTGQPLGLGFAESWSNPVWERLRGHLDEFDGGFAYSETDFNLAAGGEAQVVNGFWASGAFFETLGVTASVGRTFTASDDVRGGGADGPVVVISHDFWQRHFGGAADAVGKSLTIDRVPFKVIGVTPPRFSGAVVGRTFDVALPLGVEPLIVGTRASGLDQRGRNWLRIMLRLRPGQTIDVGTAILQRLQPDIRESTLPSEGGEYSARYMRNPLRAVSSASGWSPLRARFQQPLTVLMVLVVLGLLIACANVANLLVARAAARHHEVRVRLALGAGRMAIAREMFLETALLASLAGVLGLLFARWTSELLVAQLSSDVDQIYLDVSVDWHVLGFNTAVACMAALLCGAVTAWRSTRIDAHHSLTGQIRSSGAAAQPRMASALVVAQVALSLMLVVSAGLFARTLVALATRDMGFTAERVLIVDVHPPMTRFASQELNALYARVLGAVSNIPGIERAALSDLTPTSGAARTVPILVRDNDVPERDRLAFVNVVSPGWFSTYGTRLLSGRDFNDVDRVGSIRVGIVNEAFARRFLNGENPIGRTIRDGAGVGNPIEIVGYVADAVYRSLRDPAPPTLYTAFSQRAVARPFVSITLRTSTAMPLMLNKSVAAAVASVSSDLDLVFRPLADQVGAQLTQERLVAMLASFFGVLALLLAALGLYGVMAQAVSRRRGEIGVRMALGADHAAILRMVLGRVARLTTLGVVAGAALSWWASQFLSASLLYGLGPRDPGTFVSAAATLALVALGAGFIPARRAALLNPTEALRVE